ncbi:MAG: TlpA family protein disulfide reductase [Chitinophagaceae bacterium]|nr:TlpA family protein disulfide reductase [Chitinophagaceae bacterium]
MEKRCFHWRKLCLIMYLYVIAGTAIGQSLKRIHAGESLPPIKAGSLLNFSKPELDFSDFKGRAIILDFWGTGCVSCLRSFRYLDSLQEALGDKLQVILVNTNSRDSVESFFLKRKKLHRPSVIMINADTQLHQLFPHTGVPFQVWIDPKGVVRHFTRELFANDVVAFSEERGREIENTVGRRQKIPILNQPWKDKSLYYSFFSMGTDTALIPDANDSLHAGITVTLSHALNLFKFAFNEKDQYAFDQPWEVILETSDKEPFEKPKGKEKRRNWESNHLLGYQLQVPISQKKNVYRYMQEDLKRFFGVQAYIDKRSMRCLVLTQSGKMDQLRSKGGPCQNNFNSFADTDNDDEKATTRYYTNGSFDFFVKWLKAETEYQLQMPFVSEVSYPYAIDIQAEGHLLDNLTPDNINKILRRYGLVIETRYRKIDVLVIRDENEGRRMPAR